MYIMKIKNIANSYLFSSLWYKFCLKKHRKGFKANCNRKQGRKNSKNLKKLFEKSHGSNTVSAKNSFFDP